MDTSTTLGSASIDALALFGKTAVALLIVVGFIFLCSYLMKRFDLIRRIGTPAQRLKVISNIAVGSRERVVIVSVDDRELVLGVTTGQITKLLELPAGTPANFKAALDAQSTAAQAAHE